jgi:hypothetical protein
MAEIAEIAGVVIESEDVLSLGNSVMDKVAGDNFPPIFKVSEIKGLLDADVEYDRSSASIVMLDNIIERLGPDKLLTKNDLLNIMAFNHADADMLYNTSVTNVGLNKAKPLEGRVLSKEDKMRIVKLYPYASKARIQEIFKTNLQGRKMLFGGQKNYTYGRFNIAGGEIVFSPPHFKEYADKGIPQAEIDAFRQRISNTVASRIATHSVKLDRHEAENVASKMNSRLERFAVLMGPVLDAAFEHVVNVNKNNSPSDARSLWLAMMEDYEIAALRISFMDYFSGDKASRSSSYTHVGGYDSAIDATSSMSRGLERIHGEKSVAKELTESGGNNQKSRTGVISQGFQPSLMMLHGHFVYGNIPDDAGLVRIESGVEYGPAAAMKRKERNIFSKIREVSDANHDTGTSYRDMLFGSGEGQMRDLFRESYDSWSDGDNMSSLMGRMNSFTEVAKTRYERYEAMRDYLNGISI